MIALWCEKEPTRSYGLTGLYDCTTV